MIEALTAAGALAGKELFTSLVKGVYQLIVDQTGRRIKQWNTERQIALLYHKIESVRRVKTIWQVDKAVDILEFYCDSHVLRGEKRLTVRKLSDFGTSDNLLVEGIAGQGKSIFLRYLCATELVRGQYIPVFVELRRIDSSHTLMNRIFSAFAALGLTVDEAIFEALAASGRILLLLDAFDEIPDYLKGSVLTDIEDLLAAQPNLRLIVTARPDQAVRSSSHLTTVKLDHLRGTEYIDVITKLARTTPWGDALANHIGQKAPHLHDLLTTPLMVTLLVILYKSYTVLPTSLSGLYDALFPTLLQRHDGTKPGFTRERRCALDDTQYLRVFEAFCILTKKTGTQSLDTDRIYSIAEQALQHCGFSESASSWVYDVVTITCLLVRDGEEYRFIHKTVQEYHTAVFVRKKPDAWIREFYGRILASGGEREWQQELQFLAEIDEHRYNEFYFLPGVTAFFGCELQELHLTKEYIRCVLESKLRSHLIRVERSGGWSWHIGEGNFAHKDFSFRLVESFGSELSDYVMMANIAPSQDRIKEVLRSLEDDGFSLDAERAGSKVVLGADLLQDANVARKLEAAAENYCSELAQRGRDVAAALKKAQDPYLLDGLL